MILTRSQFCRNRESFHAFNIQHAWLYTNFRWFRKTEAIVEASDQSVLVQLLQTTPVKQEKPPVLNYQPEAVQYHGTKRGSAGQADDFMAKRAKVPPPLVPLPYAQQHQQRTSNSSSLMELLTERPTHQSSVLQNLLVSGHDSQTGHDLHGRRDSIRSPSRLVSIAQSLKVRAKSAA